MMSMIKALVTIHSCTGSMGEAMEPDFIYSYNNYEKAVEIADSLNKKFIKFPYEMVALAHDLTGVDHELEASEITSQLIKDFELEDEFDEDGDPKETPLSNENNANSYYKEDFNKYLINGYKHIIENNGYSSFLENRIMPTVNLKNITYNSSNISREALIERKDYIINVFEEHHNDPGFYASKTRWELEKEYERINKELENKDSL